MDGLEVVKKLREWSTVPIIIISASGQEERKVEALDAGTDDYLTKPFGSAELSARIRVALRHAAHVREVPSTVVTIGDNILRRSPDSTEEQHENASRMLENLGHIGTLDEMIAAFQSDYGLPEKPRFDQKTNDELIRVHGGGVETPDRDDGPPYDPQFDLLEP